MKDTIDLSKLLASTEKSDRYERFSKLLPVMSEEQRKNSMGLAGINDFIQTLMKAKMLRDVTIEAAENKQRLKEHYEKQAREKAEDREINNKAKIAKIFAEEAELLEKQRHNREQEKYQSWKSSGKSQGETPAQASVRKLIDHYMQSMNGEDAQALINDPTLIKDVEQVQPILGGATGRKVRYRLKKKKSTSNNTEQNILGNQSPENLERAKDYIKKYREELDAKNGAGFTKRYYKDRFHEDIDDE
jgi:hypothetical protein